MFTESREESHASWVSGLSTYVVAINPGTNTPVTMTTGGNRPFLAFNNANTVQGETAINIGTEVRRNNGENADDEFFYQKDYIHADSSRWYGPSSAHPGIIQAAFGDGHSEAILEDIDAAVFMHRVTRAGGEVINDNN